MRALAIVLSIAWMGGHGAMAKPKPLPTQLAPGEGYIAFTLDTLQPLSAMDFSIEADDDKTVRVGGDYPAGKHLVVHALRAGEYCLASWSIVSARWSQTSRTTCFTVEAGVVNYGGHLIPRSFTTDRGTLAWMIQVSDPGFMIKRIEQEQPEIWAKYKGSPQRYAEDDRLNLRSMYGIGQALDNAGAYKEARKFLNVAAGLGSGGAMTLIGLQYFKGNGVDEDDAQAADWFARGAEAGNGRAAAMHCIALDLGKGIPVDHARALDRCSRAAELEDTMGTWYLGSMLRTGRPGLPADPVRAEELQAKAELDEDLPAQMYWWSYPLYRGDGADKAYPDPEGAYRIAKLALDRDVTDVRKRIAYFTLKGIGTAIDGKEADRLYVQAAKDGWSNGYMQAAMINCRGEGKPQDLKRCRELLDAYADARPGVGPNEAAWFMATTSLDAMRDGKHALFLSQRALKNSPDNAAYLDTRAAALAEVGKWDEAIALQQRAITILRRNGASEKTVETFVEHLERFKRHEPVRVVLEPKAP